MEELPGKGSRRPSRGDKLEEKGGCRMWQKKVVATEIVGRTKKMENIYFSGGEIFLENDIFFLRGEKKKGEEKKGEEKKGGKGKIGRAHV